MPDVKKYDHKWEPSKDYPHFVYDPEDWGWTYFKTAEDAEAFADECILDYIVPGEGWDEDCVMGISVGKITARPGKVDRIKRPCDALIDLNGYDLEDNYWAEGWEERLSYRVMPLDFVPEEPKVFQWDFPVSPDFFQARDCINIADALDTSSSVASVASTVRTLTSLELEITDEECRVLAKESRHSYEELRNAFKQPK